MSSTQGQALTADGAKRDEWVADGRRPTPSPEYRFPRHRHRISPAEAIREVLATYSRLLRPSVLGQLSPEVAALVNMLPAVDRQNKAILGRLFVHGGLAYAKEGPDGRMRAVVRIPPGQLVWSPALIVMPRAGELELELFNDDPWDPHGAVLPSNGDKQWVWLPIFSRGSATLELDGPGYHWFSSPLGNNQGRGMLGGIVVLGDVAPAARLDRPPQPRP